MPLKLCGCALHRFRHRHPNWTLLIKKIFKFFSALMQWLAFTIFFATTLLHLRTHSLKNYSLIFLHAFTLKFLITLPTNILRMKNQLIQLIHLFLHSTLMIRPFFLRYFIPYFCIFLGNSKFYHKDRYRTVKKGRRPRTTDDLYLPLASNSLSQKPPLLARAFSRSFHSAADHSSICRRNRRRSKKVWLFRPIKAACNSNKALSPAADRRCFSHRSPYKVCRKVENRAEIGGIVYTNPACPLYWRVACRHISSPNSDREE